MFQFVMLVILSKRVEDAMARAAHAEHYTMAESIDEMSLDDNAAHAAKEGKWAQGATRGVRNALFFSSFVYPIA